MRKYLTARIVMALGVAGLGGAVVGISGAVSGAQAQEFRATGALLSPQEDLLSFPQTPTYRNYLPEAVDLSPRMPSPGDQGRQGSCVGWAVGYAARSYYRVASDGKSLSFNENIASPGFIYDAIRGDEQDCSAGSYISDALNLLTDFGSLNAAQYPYDDRSCRALEPAEHAARLGFGIKGWARVDTENLDQVKGELARGHPVIISARLDRGFFRLSSRNPFWIGSTDPEDNRGGHAMTIVGFDDRAEQFRFLNSWGSDWGQGGYGFMDYDTFARRVNAAYVIRPNTEPKKPPAIEVKPAPTPEIEVLDVALPVLDCALLRAERHPGGPKIRGFVQSETDRAAIVAQFGADFAIEVDLRPWPMCEALLITQNSGAAATIALHSPQTRIGDDFIFSVTTPNFSSHLHLAYLQADGQIVNLFQSSLPNLVTYAPGTTLRLGDGSNGYPRFEITPPVGQEMILAITTKSPLFHTQRPLIEDARAFLSALRAATIDMQSHTGVSRYYAADHLAVTTKEK